jgi:TRAP-type C4-dicarboxylate transport system permease large subunit
MFATYRAVAPFVVADVFRLGLLVVFPSISLCLMWLLAD